MWAHYSGPANNHKIYVHSKCSNLCAHCNMLVHSLQGREVENLANDLRGFYFQNRCLAVLLTGRALWQKLWLHDTKQCTQMQMEQEVFILADISSSDGCAMQLISQEEG